MCAPVRVGEHVTAQNLHEVSGVGMSFSSQAVEQFARLGANLHITEEAYSAAVVEQFIRVARAAGGHVTVAGAKFSAAAPEQFIRVGGNHVAIRL